MTKPPYLITIDYPPERGGVARYLGDVVTASNGGMKVLISDEYEPVGPGNPTPVRMFRQQWPRWWPIVGICHRLRKEASCLLVSHILPVGTAAMISHWFGGPKYVILAHGLDIRRAYTGPHRRMLARMILKQASAVVANSHATEEEIQKCFGISSTVITPGVYDRTFPSKEDARLRLDVKPEEHVILAVGRLVERKGFDDLISAAKLLPPNDDIRIVIIGRGPDEAQLVELAKDCSHRIQFIGNASDEHVNEWYAAANVFCLPINEDEVDFEGFGIVFLEAALAGLPIVAGRAGGAPEALVDRETGLLVNGSDAKETARALMILLGDEEKQHAFGKAGRKRVLKDFRWSDRWNMFENIFSNIEINK
ncbi:MAG: glycosyltransferase family 4 protein [Patescibacteria group bacterium]